ncbi:phage holin family protein [Pandoraea nosoerga]|uniref:phage holin family protein n=1 Tax=Pandoraea nosoerga TaxID=2508296 RepID=UPI00197FA156|nr:phage holin family protein [Pandoraea nosoerga]MBN4667211.1 phage holin family protein [Pandoraea nosoerga]MBN4677198.1 phage holin family protein [Pandoraea nosoerga]MBN4681980.1 phage holin family protein [Pandoraea nosoerga]MBN4746298.1 phage holin family protein [Pandoraea nosoerga]
MSTLAFLNAVLCAVIALRLMMFRRASGSHRPWASRLAYALILATGSVPIRAIFGAPPPVDVTSLAINAVLCIAVLAVRGNVVDLFRCGVGHDNPITRLLRKTHDHAR